jgi:hypothetical protein
MFGTFTVFVSVLTSTFAGSISSFSLPSAFSVFFTVQAVIAAAASAHATIRFLSNCTPSFRGPVRGKFQALSVAGHTMPAVHRMCEKRAFEIGVCNVVVRGGRLLARATRNARISEGRQHQP